MEIDFGKMDGLVPTVVQDWASGEVQTLSRAGLERLRESVTTLARCEGLEAHARAIEVRR